MEETSAMLTSRLGLYGHVILAAKRSPCRMTHAAPSAHPQRDSRTIGGIFTLRPLMLGPMRRLIGSVTKVVERGASASFLRTV